LLQCSAGRKFTLCAALDPDADRARFGDAHMDVDMNRFGAIAYACILNHVMKGGIASTAPSSDFALEIAKQENQKVFELAVGFKEFRECLLAYVMKKADQFLPLCNTHLRPGFC
jgi:phosphomannomutase